MPEPRFIDDPADLRSIQVRTAETPDVRPIAVREKAFLGHINLRGDPDDATFMACVTGVLGFALPTTPNTSREVMDQFACWLGPAEWLLSVPADNEQTVAAALRDALAGAHASVVEVGGGHVVLLLTGNRVRDLLAKGCPLDLHASKFGAGQCAQSHLGKAPILARAVADGIELVVRRSFADYVWRWLQICVQEYGGRIDRNEAQGSS